MIGIVIQNLFHILSENVLRYIAGIISVCIIGYIFVLFSYWQLGKFFSDVKSFHAGATLLDIYTKKQIFLRENYFCVVKYINSKIKY